MRLPRRPAEHREHGFTIIEVMVTSALVLVVLAIVLPQLTSSINNFDNARVRSDSADAAQLALDQIQHDVVSSNVVYLASGVVHLQVFGGVISSSSTTSSTAVPVTTCVEYQVAGSALQRQTKPLTSPTWSGKWSTLINSVANSSQTGSPAVFTVNPQNPRSLVVNLWVNADTRTINKASPSRYVSTFTGRAIPSNPSAIPTAAQLLDGAC